MYLLNTVKEINRYNQIYNFKNITNQENMIGNERMYMDTQHIAASGLSSHCMLWKSHHPVFSSWLWCLICMTNSPSGTLNILGQFRNYFFLVCLNTVTHSHFYIALDIVIFQTKLSSIHTCVKNNLLTFPASWISLNQFYTSLSSLGFVKRMQEI